MMRRIIIIIFFRMLKHEKIETEIKEMLFMPWTLKVMFNLSQFKTKHVC